MLDSGKGVSLVRILYGLGSVSRPRDRQMEAEADRLGTRYLARAGYAPEAMLQFIEWLEAVSPEEKTGLAALLRTHPFHSERANHVREVLAEPDLREMPASKTNLLTRISAKGAGIAGITNAVPVSTNVLSKTKNISVGIATNLWHNRPKLSFGKGKVGEAEFK